MGSIDERHPEYREALRLTTYPFVPGATLTNAAGRFIPQEAFVDACLHPPGVSERLYISSVVLDGTTVTLKISTETLTEVCSVEWSSLSNPPETLALVDSTGRPAGTLVAEPAFLRVIHAWGVGTHLFNMEQTEFCSACLLPQPSTGVIAFRLANGDTVSNKAWLVGGIGVRLSVREVDGRPIIRVDAVGEPLFRRRLCSEPGQYEAPVILRQLRIEQADRDPIIIRPNAMGAVRFDVGRYLTDKPALKIDRDGVICMYIIGDREDQL